MDATLETARLRLRRWTEADVRLLAQLASDQRVVRYIGNRQCWPPDRVSDVSQAVLKHWLDHGFGWRVAVEKGSEDPVGFVALNYAGEGTAGLDPEEFEIGWWLLPSVWGRGFATEAARAVCEEAFTSVGAPSVIARVQPDNLASVRVAARLGMSREFETTGRFGERVLVDRLLGLDRL